MSGKLRLLVDVRDNENLRGFHALAALHLIADRLRSAELYRIGGERPDERIACNSFTFDTGVELRDGADAIASNRRFDVYLSAADALPSDEISIAARRAARRTVAALMFGSHDREPGFAGVVLAGHDTAAIAGAVLSELQAAPAS